MLESNLSWYEQSYGAILSESEALGSQALPTNPNRSFESLCERLQIWSLFLPKPTLIFFRALGWSIEFVRDFI
jgi:hypothetical protein